MKTIAEIQKIREQMQAVVTARSENKTNQIRVAVGMATCGLSAGARPVYDALGEELAKRKLANVELTQTGCLGMCRLEPIVEVFVPGQDKITYCHVNAEKAKQIVEEHIVGGKVVESLLYCEDGKTPVKALSDTNFYKKQTRVALRNCGVINPENIDEYIGKDGFQALIKALTEMTPQQVIDEVSRSGLRGRGGAGFPTGRKWQFTKDAVGEQKYVCCNADEGDPGAFMDRSVLEGDPLAVVEAMTIAAYAVGASQGYVYVRAEYPTAVKRLQIAINQAKEYGLLGNNILSTGFNFDLQIRLGAGAFVCGEETALMTSIEGKRGEPRPRPPFPAVKGLFQKPTLLNNVETYANVAQIILKGADWFASMGSEKSKGTKVFALGGKINNTGLVEVPMGTSLRTVIEDIGGGIPNGKKFKAAQTGGPSGGCIPAELIDTPIDYDSLIAIGSMMGSGGLIVMDEDNCMVDIAKFFLDFTVDESCGKCTPCRIGTKRLYEMLARVTDGTATENDIVEMEKLCHYIKENALCGLGQSAPNPVLSTLKYFRNEYEAHVKEKTCPAGVCKSLVRFNIDAEKCIGCGMCAKNCPAEAISVNAEKQVKEGKRLPYLVIDSSKCVKCGSCMSGCKFGAIYKK